MTGPEEEEAPLLVEEPAVAPAPGCWEDIGPVGGPAGCVSRRSSGLVVSAPALVSAGLYRVLVPAGLLGRRGLWVGAGAYEDRCAVERGERVGGWMSPISQLVGLWVREYLGPACLSR